VERGGIRGGEEWEREGGWGVKGAEEKSRRNVRGGEG